MLSAIAGPSILDVLTELHPALDIEFTGGWFRNGFRRCVGSRFARFPVLHSCALIAGGLYVHEKH